MFTVKPFVKLMKKSNENVNKAFTSGQLGTLGNTEQRTE
jgi:hypothetical protein